MLPVSGIFGELRHLRGMASGSFAFGYVGGSNLLTFLLAKVFVEGSGVNLELQLRPRHRVLPRRQPLEVPLALPHRYAVPKNPVLQQDLERHASPISRG